MKFPTKLFKTYAEQIELLEQRGMFISDRDEAENLLRTVSYYRLSGYWFPLRKFDQESEQSTDAFREGTTFELVKDLYHFDERLRHTVFSELSAIELAIRAMLGHALGRISPLAHLDPHELGARARQSMPGKNRKTRHAKWLENFERALASSKEDFVAHHKSRYDGKLPIWVAVEVMDWGMLSHLYSMAPNPAQQEVAKACNLTAPQLGCAMRLGAPTNWRELPLWN